MESSATCRPAAESRQMASWLRPSWPRYRALVAAGLAVGRLVCWLLGLAAVLACSTPALAEADRFEVSLVGRTLGYRDLREPTSFTPSATFLPQQGGWVRNWTEQRGYVEAVYRFLDTRQVVLALGGQIGASVGRFEAKNVAQGVYEAWETRPAFLWGPCARLILRRQPGEGIFARFDYALFSAAAPEAREEGANRSGGGTPPSARDAFFAWTSHEATARLGYAFGGSRRRSLPCRLSPEQAPNPPRRPHRGLGQCLGRHPGPQRPAKPLRLRTAFPRCPFSLPGRAPGRRVDPGRQHPSRRSA